MNRQKIKQVKKTIDLSAINGPGSAVMESVLEDLAFERPMDDNLEAESPVAIVVSPRLPRSPLARETRPVQSPMKKSLPSNTMDEREESDDSLEARRQPPANRALPFERDEEEDILEDPGIKRIVAFAKNRRSLPAIFLTLSCKLLLWTIAIAAVCGLAWAISRGFSVEDFKALLRGAE